MEPILEIRNLNSFYHQGGGAFSKKRTVQVLKNVNVTLGQGRFWAWWGSPAAASPPWPSPSWA